MLACPAVQCCAVLCVRTALDPPCAARGVWDLGFGRDANYSWWMLIVDVDVGMRYVGLRDAGEASAKLCPTLLLNPREEFGRDSNYLN